jgi:polygalacturonase
MTTLIPKFKQSGTGAVNRAINLKLAETISVKDFGAVGDGTTDDTAAFNAAKTAATPQAVLVPAASYKITGTVTGKFYSFGVVTIVTGTVTSITNLVP